MALVSGNSRGQLHLYMPFDMQSHVFRSKQQAPVLNKEPFAEIVRFCVSPSKPILPDGLTKQSVKMLSRVPCALMDIPEDREQGVNRFMIGWYGEVWGIPGAAYGVTFTPTAIEELPMDMAIRVVYNNTGGEPRTHTSLENNYG